MGRHEGLYSLHLPTGHAILSSMQPTPTTTICNACGDVFPRDPLVKGRPHVFCSEECKKTGRFLTIRHCMWCADAYSILTYGCWDRFCSTEHEREHIRLRDRNNTSTKQCASCTNYLKNPRKRWCSWACMLSSSNEDSLACTVCEKEIPIRDHELSVYPKFCSDECRRVHVQGVLDANAGPELTQATVESSTKVQIYKDALFAANTPVHAVVVPGANWPRASGGGFSHRMRFPEDFSVPDHVKRSLAYWAMQCSSGSTPASVATLNAALSFQRPAKHPYMPLAFEQVAHFLPRKLYKFKQEVLYAHRSRPISTIKIEREFLKALDPLHEQDPTDHLYMRHLALVSWHRPEAELPWVLGQLNLTLMECDLALEGGSGLFGAPPREYITMHPWSVEHAQDTFLWADIEANGPQAVDGRWWWSPANRISAVRNHNQYILRHGMLAPKGYKHHGAVYPTWSSGMVPTHDPT